MEARGIEFLIMQSSNEFCGGYVKYFTDIPARHGVPDTVIFPRDDRMTVVKHGPEGGDTELPDADEMPYRGAKRILTAPFNASVDFTKHYAAEIVAGELGPAKGVTIGLVGTGSFSYAFGDRLKALLSGARFVDATDMVDRIKAVKSEEEIECIRKAAAMQDICLAEAFKAVKPGKRDFEIAAVAQHVGQDLGSEQGLFLAGSAPVGAPCNMYLRHFTNRQIESGDQFTLLVENNGPGGFYVEVGRQCVVGKAPQAMIDELEFVKEAQRHTLGLMKPGADPGAILEDHNEFMRKHGRPEEKRSYAHGQGYDLVERPQVQVGETMKIAPNMNMACHPSSATDALWVFLCDNYLITENGVGERLHKTPQKIFEV